MWFNSTGWGRCIRTSNASQAFKYETPHPSPLCDFPGVFTSASMVLAFLVGKPMATLIVRDLPDELVQRIEAYASTKGHSLEQEVRELLEIRYASRSAVIHRMRQRWSALPTTTADEVTRWQAVGQNALGQTV